MSARPTSLSGIALLAKHLTATNRDSVLTRAAHKTKREIEELITELAPRPEVAPTIRKQPVRRVTPGPERQLRRDKVEAASEPAPQVPRKQKPAVEPLASERYKVTFTADAALRDKLRRLEALLQTDLAEVKLGQVPRSGRGRKWRRELAALSCRWALDARAPCASSARR